ncbi:MAG: cation transporter [Candidatus Abyssobacteria bacterium SURF_17]|jgi:cobalt-zinc-cadmium efflux system protein|uniref:Cation transporter n=1 Tax=Candidatus Abyssobacteria bacterium SURF_17 TaxID=2093361 RepID=A0A419ER95_9BACT|nr:MAG: cation transporter [Candidatus Abyssubacteria bacterium SURF_17]
MIHFHRPLSTLPHFHEHEETDHRHLHRAVERKRLALTMALTGSTMAVEVIGALFTGSLALLSDAGHMLTHFFALMVSFVAIRLAALPTRPTRSFGLYRIEVLAALFNGVTLLFIIAYIFYEAVGRLLHPSPIKELPMLAVALVGLAVNIASAFILLDVGRTDLNVRSAFLHMVGDTASSVGIVAGAIAIYLTGWYVIDPLLSMLIGAVILIWSWNLLRDSTNILLETAPKHIDVSEVIKAIKDEAPEITDVHDVHIWEITSQMYSMTAHLVFREDCRVSECASVFHRLNTPLLKKFQISHVNFSPEHTTHSHYAGAGAGEWVRRAGDQKDN